MPTTIRLFLSADSAPMSSISSSKFSSVGENSQTGGYVVTSPGDLKAEATIQK